mmetsp:Transcript_13960/g.15901  ORF Transcript_13960/g.15901 Transcript_13960/m.15901 type:complete len:217 (-) Transcript_13960:109-759(-)|eukprot:CAMPEP_0184017964 /NCGR_PEP_ID=MMETSP0954-20121128/7858_1 /TAXON_ID=627963 /ORGANISM="Aplanochytrium sp, Strain PBS07" /LENGTH=216 /DNA_ID=CAMNT_0026299317 /DNA_START=176 /DNA_END=826 /DNA_ORIENTATION=+
MAKQTNLKKRKQLTGWWDCKEHNRFVEGLKKHGRDWKKVAEVVGTRNAIQVRSHAQKFFLKPQNRLLYPPAQSASKNPKRNKRQLNASQEMGIKKTKYEQLELPTAESILEPLETFVPIAAKSKSTNNWAAFSRLDYEMPPSDANGLSFSIDELLEVEKTIATFDPTVMQGNSRLISPENSVCEAEAIIEEWDQSHELYTPDMQFHIPLSEGLHVL